MLHHPTAVSEYTGVALSYVCRLDSALVFQFVVQFHWAPLFTRQRDGTAHKGAPQVEVPPTYFYNMLSFIVPPTNACVRLCPSGDCLLVNP